MADDRQDHWNRNCARPSLCLFCNGRLYTKEVLGRLMDVLFREGSSRREARITGVTWLDDSMFSRQKRYNACFMMLRSPTFGMRSDRNRI